ncbi:hypothetical protein F5Y18DRAFT_444331 [Xylariaceae sp. FL1019]|nr:hypothetical protein F5Y18DRAFT_444331 [Xylariaceae sp. FL1019]
MGPHSPILVVPRELRLDIYKHILLLELDSKIIQSYCDSHSHGRSLTTLQRHPDSKLVVPWLCLMHSCKLIKEELSAYMNTASASITDNTDYVTYVLNIVATRRDSLSNVTWQNVPCPPTRIKNLVVNLEFRGEKSTRYPGRITDARFWVPGSPMGIARHLYQTMNLVLHNGVVLDREKPLSPHLSFEGLIVNLPASEPLYSERGRPDLSENGHSVAAFMRAMKGTGLLWT